jgi:hypothetical protein
MESTDEFLDEGVNPGGYYKAVWCRDASYILKDWFLAGRFGHVMQEILYIWSHQIHSGGEKIIYGRGSPEANYRSQVARPDTQKRFEGALPTTIFHGFSEVYGHNPDIDSTALMISTTAWAFDSCLKAGLAFPSSFQQASESQELAVSAVVSNPETAIEFVVPKMLRAIDHLAGRDVDGDGLLEQGHNEDWMDTVLRKGKIVYSQACWILALGNLAALLSELGMEGDAARLSAMARRATDAVEKNLWSEQDGSYVDWHDESPHKALTQDVALYLIAITENARAGKGDAAGRARATLDTLRGRIWKDRWPLVTESELKKTGPWVLHPNQYHNHTFWPWITGIEMLARSRYGRIEECEALFSVLASSDSQSKVRAYYEWVNPVTNQGSGAYPFRTGISTIRIALSDLLNRLDGGQ